ncbi:patatin-like phospholipase family protein [Paludibacterium yongneupense]|uniref:patatin-like phospholipase family protein n=1 Tax=Paludibacterium yongneupense TaxID=400061 RepID=UPI00041DE0FF|nr:patatin-like phospholipase family protein [Paludibacterium yongneupense]
MAAETKIGLVLAGGGARAAYQVGVLLAVARLLPDPHRNPFAIISGTSGGAINAAGLAAGARDFRAATVDLARSWRQLHISDVYRSSPAYFLKTFLHFGVALLSGGRLWKNPPSVLDNAPLRDFLERTVALADIDLALQAGALDALALTASCYSTGLSVSFFQGRPELDGWSRQLRQGVRDRLGIDHLMASCAIPLLFPAVDVAQRFYCDGAVRQLSPLSPPLHLGADKLFIIGLGNQRTSKEERRFSDRYPTPAQMLGHLLNSVFLDSLALDLERLERINETLAGSGRARAEVGESHLRRVDVLTLNPSRSLESIAFRHLRLFPPVLRFILHGAGGTNRRGSALASYLLFEPGYCRELIALGFRDAMDQGERIRAFLEL